MRGLIVTLIVFGAVPWMLYYPFTGLMFWVGLGYLNPHRLTWGFAHDLPFVQVAAIVTHDRVALLEGAEAVPAQRRHVHLAAVHALGVHHDAVRAQSGGRGRPSWCASSRSS